MKNILYIFILSFTLNTFSQGEANVWYFGYNAGLDFNSPTPTPLTNGQLSTREGCSSFSDASGNLLFYIGAPTPDSPNLTVWNSAHTPMPGGIGLKGDASSSQSAMIIPKPGSTTEYFVFTVGAQSSDNAGFWYYTIDMSLNGGLGDVVGGANGFTDLTLGIIPSVNSSGWTEKVAAVKGADCETFWVVSMNNNWFYSYEVTDTGVSSIPVPSQVPYFENDPRGYLKLSPDGTKLAIGHYAQSDFILYDFDDATGAVSNERRLPLLSPNTHPYGVEFSANSQKLYTHATNALFSENPNQHTSTLYQFDISSPILADINASRVIIDNRNLYRGALQLGPDHKIYRALSQTYTVGIASLGVIENPEEDGLACNYQHASISLGGATSSQGLPPFISSIFSQIEITADDGAGNTSVVNNQIYLMCTGENFSITPETITLPGTTVYNWFKDELPYSNSANLNFLNVSPTDNGIYILDAEFTDICGNQITLEAEFELAVYDPPVATTPQNIIECDDDNNGTFPFDLLQKDTVILNGQPNTDFEVLYFTSQDDADNNTTNSITSPYVSGSTTIYARIQSRGNADCYDTTSFDIELYDAAFPLDAASILPIQECDNTSVGSDTDGRIVFDLTERDADILNGQSAVDFTLTYFIDDLYTFPITTPSNAFENTIDYGQTIYVRMTNNLKSTCFTDTAFEIEVFQLPVIQSTYLFKNCDVDGNPDNLTDFNLDEANEFITNGNSSLIVTYYTTFADADSGGSNNINASLYNNSNGNTVYARVENTNGCHRVSTINLQVSTTSFLAQYLGEELDTCDDDDENDGLHLFDLTEASTKLIAEFLDPNLSVHYYRTLINAQLEQDEILPQNSYPSVEPFSQTLYVRIESDTNGDCFGIGPYLTLIVHPRPEFEVVEPTAIVCLNLPPITLATINPSDAYTYEWEKDGVDFGSGASVEASEGGKYTVIATSTDGNNCVSEERKIVVTESNIATINLSDITVTDDSDNNTITIDTTNLGIGDYEFTLDDEFGIYQDQPFFDRVTPGLHLIYIRDKKGCGVSPPLEVSVIGFPKFFTPNNDGQNDYWQIKGVSDDFFATSLIYVYDRFGKMIAKIDPTSDGWDGFYNGEALPSTDYWFTAQLVDQEGNVRDRNGHFSLIRR